MDWNRLLVSSSTQEQMNGLFDYLLNGGIDEYLEATAELLGQTRLSKRTDASICEQAFPRNYSDFGKAVDKDNFYIANARCFEQCIRQVLDTTFVGQFHSFSPARGNALLIQNYQHLFRAVLLDSAFLHVMYQMHVQNKAWEDVEPKVGKSSEEHEFPLYVALTQAVFGQSSFHSPADLNIDTGAALVRQMLELRLRRAFGIVGIIRTRTKPVEPVPMGVLFDALKGHQDDIDFSVPLPHIHRLYQWANLYLHDGFRSFAWQYVFVIHYLSGLMRGDQVGKVRSIDYGIKSTQKTVDAVRADVEQIINGRSAKKSSAGGVKLLVPKRYHLHLS